MIELIYGKKGSGKTKKLIESANESIKEAKGYVVFIDDNNRYMYDLHRDIRFIAAQDYPINSPTDFINFICGGVATNYGIEALYIDGLLKIVKAEYNDLENFFDLLEDLSEKNGFKAVLTISAEKEALPVFLEKYI